MKVRVLADSLSSSVYCFLSLNRHQDTRTSNEIYLQLHYLYYMYKMVCSLAI